MFFVCDGYSYNTDDMNQYEISDSGLLCIYATPDRGQVFKVMMGSTGIAVRRANDADINYLSAQQGLGELRQAVPR